MHPLTTVRTLRGWTYQRTARVIASRARQFGVHNMATERQKIWRWEHRGVIPDRVSQLALDIALGVPVQQVNTCRWPTWLPTQEPRTCQADIAALRRQLAEAGAEIAALRTRPGAFPVARLNHPTKRKDAPEIPTNSPPRAEYELAVPHGMTVADLRHALEGLPDDATFENYAEAA